MKSNPMISKKFLVYFFSASFLLCFGNILNAQVIKAFTQRPSLATPTKLIYNIKGDYTMIGNTNMTVQPYGVGTNNSNNTMVYVDVDSDPNTINSSSSTLGFSTENGAIPSCSNIIYAGLYWTGRAADGGPSPETFSVTTTSNQSLPVNHNYTVTHGNTIQYTDYTMSVSRVGSNNSYGVRYTYTSSGAGPQVLFEFLFAGPPYVRYSTNGGTNWTNPTNQVATVPGTNLRKVDFDPVTVYAPGGGIILTVNSLLRDSRGNSTIPQYQTISTASGNVGGTAIVPVTTSKSLNKRTVSLKGPGQANYTQFVANAGNIYYPDGIYGNMYSGYVEVTSYVKANGIGNYTVADLALIEGNGGATGYYGGWGMIVVYENSKMNWRDVTIFDGHAYVVGNTSVSYDLPVSGFHTAQAGAINMKLGMMAGEGDVGISGDYFRIRNHQDNAWVDLNHSGNSTTNFFNSSVNTGGNVRNPSLQNNTGVDIAMFNIPNAGNSVVTNNQTSTKFQYGSTQDTYVIFCIAMAVDAYVPDVELIVSTTYINGVPVGGGPLSAQPGQDIEYKLEVKNLGTEAINNAQFVVPLPYTTTYVAGSSSVTIHYSPPPTYTGTVTFDPLMGPTGSIVWNYGTIPLPPSPSDLLATMTFHFRVTTDCNILKNPDCPPTVTLAGGVTSGVGATSGLSFSNMPFIQGYQSSGPCINEPITDPLVIAIDADAYVAANCASTPNNRAFVFCNYTLPTIPVSSIAPGFPIGLRFFNTNNVTPSSIEYDVNNPFPALPGVHTYFAIPVGVNLCYYTFTIAVSNLTSVPTVSNVIYCLNDFASPLTATPSNPAYSLYYYSPSAPSTPTTSITPSTAIAGVTTYTVAEAEPLSLGGCISSNKVPLTVTVHDFQASITAHTDVYCNGGNTGAATVTATGGSGNYAYSWSTAPVQTAATATGLIAGNYTVNVSDNAGCGIVRTVTVSISQPSSALGANISGQTNVLCYGGTTGSATVTATGGSGVYLYSWNTTPVQTTAIATGLSALNYMVTVTDNNGCAVPVTATVSVTQPAATLSAGISGQTNVFCFGGATGTSTVAASGGSGTYSYSWNTAPVQTTATATGLAASNYTVTVTDANGCLVPQTATVSISQPALGLTAGITAQTNVLCSGGNSGSATVTAGGGSGVYYYSWNTSPAQTTAAATGLLAANYIVTVTDANGCVIPKTLTVSITQPTFSLTASITAQTNVFCKGGNTGSATATSSGGSGSYLYSWSTTPTQTTAIATGLSANNYAVTVSDANGCPIPVTLTVSITEPNIILGASITAQTNVFCKGGSTGSATVTATGGSGLYLYNWNSTPLQTTAAATGLAANNYTVVVSDANGCLLPVTLTVSITQPTFSLTASITSQTNVFCKGGSTGSATATAAGGSGAYYYSWNTSPAQTTATATGLTAVNYTVVVNDANGCVIPVTLTVSITEPTFSLTATLSAQTNVYCKGGNTGSATVTASGGSSAYFYSWSTVPVQTTNTATGLSAGNYVVTVNDANGCLVPKTVTVSIAEPAIILGASISSQTNVLCNGGNTGAATVTATGGSGVFTYSWNTIPVQTTATATGLSLGNYTVSVTDNNGCTIMATATVNITEPAVLATGLTASIYFGGYNISCSGLTDGSIDLAVSGGTLPYTYLWSSSQSSQDISGLSANTYSVLVTDAKGCTASNTVTLTQPVALSTTITVSSNYNGSSVSCFGSTNGGIDLSVAGGTTAYTYGWSNALNTQDISNIGAGTYSVLVTDKNGCTTTASVTLTQPVALSTTITPATFNGSNVSCFGSTNGGIDLTVSGGTTAYTYAWSNSQSTQDITNLTAGTYSVLITDQNGCTATNIITLSQPTALSTTITPATFNGSNVSCFGSTNGGIDLSVSGGTTAYTYAWSNSQVTQDITNLTAGTYSVLISDQNGCTTTASVTLTQPVALSTTITPATFNGSNVSCFGSNNGGIDLSVSGGTTAYTYAWSNSQVTQDITNLSAGTYSVLITDQNGCATTASVTLTQPTALSTTITPATFNGSNVSCFGSNNGGIDLTVAGGTIAYTYGWSNSLNTQDITNLIAGTYSVLVTDQNGCTATASVTLSQPVALTTTLTPATYSGGYNISCMGSNDGSIDLTIAGGTIAYTYSWSNSQVTQDITNLTAGTYSVLVTDQNGCTTSDLITLTQPNTFTTTVVAATYNGGYHISCNGLSNGSVDLTVTGGTIPYTYAWSNSQTTQDISGLNANTYSVIVTDLNGCAASASITLIEPVVLSATVTPVVYAGGYNISCNGNNNGSIALGVTGGATPYTYQWSGGSTATTQNIASLLAGTYTVVVRDANGCSTTQTVTLTEPVVLSATVTPVVYAGGYNISCNGNSDGSIALSVVGGATPYTYQWSNLATTQNITGLSAGPYSVLVTDANGCSITQTVTLTEPVVLSATVTPTVYAGLYNISCNGQNDGSIALGVSGGATPYTYQWSGGSAATTQNISGLLAGTYTVVVLDANGCSTTHTVTLTEPVVLSATVTSATYVGGYNISCNGSNNGSIALSVIGGATPYTYQWSGGSIATTQNITGIMAGTYTVVVQDANGCSSTQTLTLTEPAILSTTVTPLIYVGGYNISCNGLSNGSIDLTVAGGTPAYTYAWSNTQTTQDISGLNANVYSVIVTDANGCSTVKSITITQPVLLTSIITFSTYYNGSNVSCNGSNDGGIALTVLGGTAVYTYAWSNSATTQNLTGLTSGTYSVFVTDMNGCTTTNTFTLTQPTAITTTIAVSSNYNGQNVSCFGSANGSIDLSVSGGTPLYSYSWSNGQTTQDISGLSANTYSVLITDANGCAFTNTIIVTEPVLLTSTVTATNVFCFGGNTGTATVAASGGTTPYTYQWSSNAASQTTAAAVGLTIGTYTVLVTDINGCTSTNTVIITQPTLLVDSTSVTNALCNGSSNGTAAVYINGGVVPYNYLWSNGQTTTSITGLIAGQYIITTTDNNGCVTVDTAIVSQPGVLASVLSVSNVLCYGDSSGAASVVISGGTTPYSYIWTNGQTTSAASGFLIGSYSVSVTDSNGCVLVVPFNITQPAVLISLITPTPASCSGGNNGTATASIIGGVAPYNYLWSANAGNQTTQMATGLAAGVYYVTVTDSNGCVLNDSVQIVEISPVTLVFNSQNAACYGVANGTIDLSVTGGTQPFSYVWSTGDTSQDLSGLLPGTYFVTVQDSNGCYKTGTVTITQPDSISATYVEYFYANGFNISLNGASDGSVDLTVTGGTSPYNIFWSTGDTTEDLSFVPAGNYYVQITDSNGCVVVLAMTLTEPYELEMPTGISPNGDGNNEYFVIHGLESYPDNELRIYNRWGNLVYSADDYKQDWNGVSKNGGDLPEATYFVVLKIFGTKEITLTGYVDLRR